MIRAAQPEDLPYLYQINERSTPGVSAESKAALSHIIALSTCLVMTHNDGEPVGFLTLLAGGTAAYKSPNLRWLEAYYAQHKRAFLYVDRIAIAPVARGQGLGRALYDHIETHFRGRGPLTCEVNTAPPNPGSLKFHHRLGFSRLGEQTFIPQQKAVMYLAKEI